MNVVPILYLLLIGLIVGSLATWLTGRRGVALVANLLIGVFGAFLGAWIVGIFNLQLSFLPRDVIWIKDILSAFLAAALLLFLINVAKRA